MPYEVVDHDHVEAEVGRHHHEHWDVEVDHPDVARLLDILFITRHFGYVSCALKGICRISYFINT